MCLSAASAPALFFKIKLFHENLKTLISSLFFGIVTAATAEPPHD